MLTRKGKIVWAIIIASFLINIVALLYDSHCETFIGIIACIMPWISLPLCGLGILNCLTSDPMHFYKDKTDKEER